MNRFCLAAWLAAASAAFAQPGPPMGGPPGGAGDGIWLRNAYFGEAQTFDACVGHQPGTGQYHHHADPVCLRAQLNDNLEMVRTARTGTTYRETTAPWTHSPILGWAFDGYPIYGPYAYSDPKDATSPMQRMRSGFRLRSITDRTTLPGFALPIHNGISQQLTAAQAGPAITPTFPLGRYVEDFEFVAGLGDLDVYNGRFAVTPEFPNGTYAYYVTIDADGLPAFPYIFGMQFNGAVNGGNARAVPANAQDYFTNGAYVQPASTAPVLASWSTKNSQQYAQVVSAFNPAGGPQPTWPSDVPAGARTMNNVDTPTLADVQRIRYSDTNVYLSSNNLASYPMGPWFDALQPGGIFGAYPAVQNFQVMLPRAPVTATTKSATAMGPQGMWVNGVAVFNALDGASYSRAAGTDVGGGLVNPAAFHVSAASFEPGPLAPGSLVSAFSLFGTPLATSTATADGNNWPTTLGGATVTVRDASGTPLPAAISYASAKQIDYRLPENAAIGYATVTIAAGGANVTGNINIRDSYPNLFIADGSGLASGYVSRVSGGEQSTESVATVSIWARIPIRSTSCFTAAAAAAPIPSRQPSVE